MLLKVATLLWGASVGSAVHRSMSRKGQMAASFLEKMRERKRAEVDSVYVPVGEGEGGAVAPESLGMAESLIEIPQTNVLKKGRLSFEGFRVDFLGTNQMPPTDFGTRDNAFRGQDTDWLELCEDRHKESNWERTFFNPLSATGETSWRTLTFSENGRLHVLGEGGLVAFEFLADESVPELVYLECTNDLTFSLNGRPLSGDLYSGENWWGTSRWLAWPLRLRRGEGKANSFRAHVRGAFECRFFTDGDGGEETERDRGDKGKGFVAFHKWDGKQDRLEEHQPGQTVHHPDIIGGFPSSPFIGLPGVNVEVTALVDIEAQVHKAELIAFTVGKEGDREAVEGVKALELDVSEVKLEILPGGGVPFRLETGQGALLSLKMSGLPNIAVEDREVRAKAAPPIKKLVRLYVTVRGKTEKGGETVSNSGHVVEMVIRDPGDGFKFTFETSDGTTQYAGVLPPGRKFRGSGNKKPLSCAVVLALHGAGVDGGSTDWTRALPRDTDEGKAEEQCFWVVSPTNRGCYGFDWEGLGRANALETLAAVEGMFDSNEVLKEFPRPDTQKVLMLGHSMGGHGCLLMSANYPDYLVGSLCVSAWTERDLYDSRGDSFTHDEEAKKLLALVELSSLEYCPTWAIPMLQGLPFMARVGGADTTVPPHLLESFIERLRGVYDNREEADKLVSFSEVPGEGHWWGGVVSGTDKNGPQEFFQKVLGRPPSEDLGLAPSVVKGSPKTFSVRGMSLWGTGRGGVMILQKVKGSKPAQVDVVVSSDGTEMSMRTLNTRRVALKSPSTVQHPVEKLMIDGQTISSPPFLSNSPEEHLCNLKGSSWEVCDKGGEWKQRERSPRTTRPIRDMVAEGRWVIVYGTQEGWAPGTTASSFLGSSEVASPSLLTASSTTEHELEDRDVNAGAGVFTQLDVSGEMGGDEEEEERRVSEFSSPVPLSYTEIRWQERQRQNALSSSESDDWEERERPGGDEEGEGRSSFLGMASASGAASRMNPFGQPFSAMAPSFPSQSSVSGDSSLDSAVSFQQMEEEGERERILGTSVKEEEEEDEKGNIKLRAQLPTSFFQEEGEGSREGDTTGKTAESLRFAALRTANGLFSQGKLTLPIYTDREAVLHLSDLLSEGINVILLGGPEHNSLTAELYRRDAGERGSREDVTVFPPPSDIGFKPKEADLRMGTSVVVGGKVFDSPDCGILYTGIATAAKEDEEQERGFSDSLSSFGSSGRDLRISKKRAISLIVAAGTDLAGVRLAAEMLDTGVQRLPVYATDWMVLSHEARSRGTAGISAAGHYGFDWSVNIPTSFVKGQTTPSVSVSSQQPEDSDTVSPPDSPSAPPADGEGIDASAEAAGWAADSVTSESPLDGIADIEFEY
uniref:AB hydrolase-1 domain-containing protein n=1 Tax=Chromera velia CCMP2878 TaxID=1169474 RepID=A0A0G4I3Y9_9ALVE|eukprot:Cvel_10746.t1-p1 / transcript=Cvel_10746.t1 / gene=Cvel_10746 / organism=Chromera_velia_CCMP2878 / gene_product=hypothetical protein / transcript_product=hypothetical protein / location=Cvel_scaffold655:51929-61144(-) / protein_length=1367 / sequence_SO=supercontig / SO=protein_coding / is_pseudo=false